MDVGTESTIETIVNCPFTQHTATSDFISYDNCGGGKVCDWEAMYTWFELDYAQINLDGSIICKDWMEQWIFTEPGEQRFEYMADSFCPCLGTLKGTGYDHDSILDCIPVTFHQLTMLDLYEQICYDTYVANVDCLNYMAYGTIELAVQNYTAAALCWAAVELSGGLDDISDNLMTLMCDCLVPMYSVNYTLDDTTGDGLTCVYGEFDLDVSTCPNYAGESLNEDGSMGDFMTVSAATSIEEHPERYGTFDSSSSSVESAWRTAAIIEIPICAILALSAFFLHRWKIKISM